VFYTHLCPISGELERPFIWGERLELSQVLDLGGGVFALSPLRRGAVRSRTIGRLQDLERALLPRGEIKRPPIEVITTIEDDNGNIIEGADKLPGGKNYKPGPKLFIRVVHAVPRPDNEAEK
jgi:hypothetical protein